MNQQAIAKELKSRIRKQVKSLRHFVVNVFQSFTVEDLRRKLAALGIGAGDTLLVHSSFDAFEGFQGKPSDVIGALQALAGPNGLLMMPTMIFSGTAVDYARSNPLFDVQRTPSRMGLVTELFRRSPGVVRSVHPTHPVALWGRDAEAVATGHHLALTPCGAGSPYAALLARRGKIVLLGTGINVLTFYHMLEELLEAELPVSPFTTEVYRLRSKLRDGQIVETECRLFEPAVSKRRRLGKLVPFLKASGAWREARVGRLPIVVLGAEDVERTVRQMIKQGIHCYE